MDNVNLKSDSVSVIGSSHIPDISRILPDDELYEAIIEWLYGDHHIGMGLCYEY